MFFPMSCNVFIMGKGTADRDILALIMNFEGDVKASQDSKYFKETSLTPEILVDDKLGQIVFNDTIGNNLGFQVVYQSQLNGLKMQMQMLRDREDDTEDPPVIDTVESMRKFIYSNSTKTIYSFVGDHTIGDRKISGISMTGKTYKYV